MRHLERKVLERQYAELRCDFSDLNGFNGFNGLKEFIEEWEEVGAAIEEEPYQGFENVAYRINVEKKFEKGNVRWLCITHESEQGRPSYPALGATKND